MKNLGVILDYQNAIEINNLCKTYKGFTLDNISLSIPRGTIMGFVGQNGAGKSTTIKAILNIIKNDSGTINVFGMDHIIDEKKIKKRIAVILPSMDTILKWFISFDFSDIFDKIKTAMKIIPFAALGIYGISLTITIFLVKSK